MATDSLQTYPVLPLMTGVLYPGMMFTIQVGRESNLALIKDCGDGRRQFIAAYCHSDVELPDSQPIHQVGVIAVVKSVQDGAGGSKTVLIEGLRRTAIREIVSTEPYLKAKAVGIDSPKMVSSSLRDRMKEVISIVSEITQLDPVYSPELSNVIKFNEEDPSLLSDRVATAFHFSLSAKQELLEIINLDRRYEKLLFFLNNELNRVATLLNIDKNVKERIKDEQHKYYLRQQLYEIRRQLGEEFTEEREANRLRKVIKNSTHLPPEVIARARIEIDRLSHLSPASAEYGVTKGYLDWVLNLPWGKSSNDEIDMAKVERIISTDYYGPVNLKEQILQRLSVRKLLGGVDESPTLCLVGAPGTGKASLARAMARALGKEFVRISVGGISDVADIKGTSRNWLGAFPGRIIRTLRTVGTSDPVVLLEDIDYFNVENDSAVNVALLEVIDTRNNARFLDDYIGIPFDLSKIMFVCSVRSYEEIPEQFVPRLEIIELPGYIEREKIVIGKKYIVPRLLKKHGLTKTDFKISDKTLSRIVSNYTQEAGLLGFSQQIEKICRKIALEKAEKKKSRWPINEKTLESYLGTAVFIPEVAEKLPELGIAAGLAWTGAGGDLMFIEGIKMRGEGAIITTGSLGEVMRESIQAAHSYVRSKADVLGIDFNDFNEFDIHIHFPSGAIPKDGPSAGITVCLVIASIMSERPIRNDIAMTGELTLQGKVLAVGGTKEKISAAYRAGLHHIALPKENEKDIKDLPKEIIRKTTFHFLERVDDLFKLCLQDFTPSAFTLEKIFAEEVKKARKSKKTKKKTTRSPKRVKSVARSSKK